MKTRYEKIGIKQVIRLEWMDKTLDMLLAGMTADAIRAELKVYLSDKKQSGGTGERGEKTYTIAIGPLMQSWVEPEGALLPLRDAVLDIARSMNFSQRIPLHWAMISAAYPFWFNVAKQVGRILNLQDQATQKQVVTRLKEQYGDRQTISRYARYAIRSFVAWGVLQDTERKGSYIKSASISIPDNSLASLLLEAALHTLPEGKGTLSMVLNTPGLFPFQLPDLTGKMTSQLNPRIEVSQTAGFDDRLLGLNNF